MPEPTPEQLRKAQAAAWATSQVGSQQWNWWCQLFAETAYGTKGQFPSALAAGNALGDKTGLNRALDKADPGDLVFFSADDTNNGYGHVGVYLGGDRMVSATPTGVKETSITQDRYYGPRFRGTAAPPAQWKGTPSTPELQAGAQKILGAVGTGATGDKAVSQTTTQPVTSPVLQQQQTKAETARRELANWTSVAQLAQENIATLQQRQAEITQEMGQPNSDVDALLGEQRQIEAQLKDMQTRGQQATTRLSQERTNLTNAEAAVAKEEQRLGTLAVEGAKPPSTTTINGQAYIWDAASESFKPAPGLPAATSASTAPQTATVNGQVYERQSDGSWTPARGLPQATPPPAPTPERQVVNGQVYERQPDGNWAPAAGLPAAQQPAPQTTTIGGRPFQWDAASSQWVPSPGLPTAPPSPVNVSASQETITQWNPATNSYESVPNPSFQAPAPEPFAAGAGQFIMQRDPTTGEVTQLPNPNYQPTRLEDPVAELQATIARAQARATQERDRLLSLQEAGTVTPEEARRRFETWWQQNVEPEITGNRALAERQREAEQRKLEEQQRTEDIRVGDINRARETAAFQSGQTAVQTVLPYLGDVRSPQYLSQTTENINRLGRGEPFQYSPDAFNPANYPVPDLTQLAAQQTARALASISPAAAQQINRPLPALPAGLRIEDLLGGLGNIPLPGV